ncbi:MAG: MlaD family protein [Deltaproteobacteria bacterium]|nr:MlaD family protein [Deltaproteobacteria bacterium]
MSNLITPLKVGIISAIIIVLIIIFIGDVSKSKYHSENSYQLSALFDDTTGLVDKTKVVIAGVNIGTISKIELEGNKARVYLRIDNKVRLYENATITKRSTSILGDYYLEINTGTPDFAQLRDGDEIKNVIKPVKIEDVFGSLNVITQDIREVTRALAEVFGSKEGKGSMQDIVNETQRISKQVSELLMQNTESLRHIMSNIEEVSKNLKIISSGSQEDIIAAIKNIRELTKDTRALVNNVQTIIGRREGELAEGVSDFRKILQKLDKSLTNIEKVTDSIEKGEGTLGKVLKDEKIAKSIEETADGISDYVQQLSRLQVNINIRDEYSFLQKVSKTFFALRLQPKEDKFYLIELIDDPRGDVVQSYTSIKRKVGNTYEEVERQETINSPPNKLKLSLEFAKKFDFITLRIGLIESTGGSGIDIDLFQQRLKFKTDIFELAFPGKNPRMRITAMIALNDYIFISTGVDDILNYKEGYPNMSRDYFLGGGIQFNDDDLKSLFSVMPTSAIKK